MSIEATRDMERARALLEALLEEAVEAAQRNAHKPGWIGMGLAKAAEKVWEEADEACMAVAQAEPHKPESILHARHELGDLVWSAAMMADDSGILLPLDDKEKESVA